MDKKRRQVTDNIHETIYLSALEAEMIATPYFYRLHDIYQSSTVYMTFPSNRTKRYEHSLGTMEIASQMLYAAVSNADENTREELFNKLRKHYREILELAIRKSEGEKVSYYIKYQDYLLKQIRDNRNENVIENINQNVVKSLEEGCFDDTALDYFQFYPLGNNNEKNHYNDVESVFLYRCLLQATRIVALFHDVGHPPYSHIMERVIEDLYEKYKNQSGENEYQQNNLEEFRKSLQNFFISDSDKICGYRTLYSKISYEEKPFHEKVGLFFIKQVIDGLIKNLIEKEVGSEIPRSQKIAKIIYYTIVVEFTMAMFAEKDIFFKSLHKIVDGFVDADRLDYIMRDSLNTGIDWGRIPYKRIINSARLFYLASYKDVVLEEDERPFVIAYPTKVMNDIEDLLLVRYKIFVRINFHHHCLKTAVVLQTAVKELAENYLENDSENNCITCDINVLWNACNAEFGEHELKAIQWNDSWLISTLHKALVRLDSMDDLGSNKKMKMIKQNLEEILLIKKYTFTLFKRGEECKSFMKRVFECAGIRKEDMDNQVRACNENLVCFIKVFQMAYETGSMEYFYEPILQMEDALDRIIKETLDALIKENRMIDYKIHINKRKKHAGIPKHNDVLDEIYLYNNGKCDPVPFDDRTLKMQIEAIERNVPWMYIYFVPTEDGHEKVKKLEEDIKNKLVDLIAAKVKDRYRTFLDSIE